MNLLLVGRSETARRRAGAVLRRCVRSLFASNEALRTLSARNRASTRMILLRRIDHSGVATFPGLTVPSAKPATGELAAGTVPSKGRVPKSCTPVNA